MVRHIGLPVCEHHAPAAPTLARAKDKDLSSQTNVARESPSPLRESKASRPGILRLYRCRLHELKRPRVARMKESVGITMEASQWLSTA